MARKKTTRIKLLKGEKLMYFLLVLVMLLIPVGNVLTQALLSETNIEVEQIKSKIAIQEKTNESLDMQIIASGGVSSIDDVKKLREMDLYGAIIGKAYYVKAISLREAIKVAR